MRLIRKHVWILALIIGPGIFRGAWDSPQRSRQPARFLDSLEKREEMIAMRDGVKLHTEIYSPKNAGEALPILMVAHALRNRQPGHRHQQHDLSLRGHVWRTATFLCFKIFAAGTAQRASS